MHSQHTGSRRMAGVAGWVVVCLAGIVAVGQAAEEPLNADRRPADVAAIRAAATAYRAAVEKGDTAAIKQAWIPDGDIVDGWGNQLAATEALAGSGHFAAGDRPVFQIGETSLRFITSDVALEDGTVDVVLPGTTIPLEGWFTAVWVRQGDAWKLAAVREAERPISPQADTLEDLGWMFGDWQLVTDATAADAGATGMEMTVRWDAGRTFLIREVRLLPQAAEADVPPVELHQRIGWDPLVNRICSWSFSTDGSRGDATWFRDGDSWVVRGSGVLPDGTQMSSVNIYSYDGKDRWIWRTMPEPIEADEGRPVRATWVRKQGRAAP